MSDVWTIELEKEELVITAELAQQSGESYTLPMAGPDVLGGVKPAQKTNEMTKRVGIDENGRLWSEKESEQVIEEVVGKYLQNNPIISEETDPTVPEWAKQPNKPTYTAAEVGALPADTVIPDGGIPVPTTASVGQTVVVKSVDETGKPTAWEPVALPSGSGGDGWKLIGEITTTEPVSSVNITGDAVYTEMIALVSTPPIPEDTGGVIYVRPVLKNKGRINANVGFTKPHTLLQRELWYINRSYAIRQNWKTGANIPGTVMGMSVDTLEVLTKEFDNGGGLVGFDIYWNQNNAFPTGVIMKVWGR